MKLKENYDVIISLLLRPIYIILQFAKCFCRWKIWILLVWYGTPTYLINMLKKFGVEPSEIGNNRVSVEDFDAPTERMTSIIPLLYQSGYITIKNYDEELDLYTLNIPNKEVRIGLMKSLLPHYVGSKAPETTTMVAYLPVISVMGIWILHYAVCKRSCPLYRNAIIRNMKDTISRSFISYSVCWGIMWMWKFVLLVDG